jgi:hypothetical protein
MKSWEEKITALPDKVLALLFMRVRRELEIRKQTRLADQEERMLRSQISAAEVAYLNKLFQLPDARERNA